MRKSFSIPSGLPINEASRLLAYLKVRFQPGYFNKSLIGRLCRDYGKDQRTFNKLLKSLIDSGSIGEDQRTYYLRSWKFITALHLIIPTRWRSPSTGLLVVWNTR